MFHRHWVNVLTRGMYASGVLLLLTGLLLTLVNLPARAQGGNSGAVWTTTGSCGTPQNVNQYQVRDEVYLNGSNFDPNTEYYWSIEGNKGGSSGDPGIAVAEGYYTTDGAGAFCFFAYTIQEDDWGVYKYGFGNKNDNYTVDGIAPAPALALDKTVTETEFTALNDVLNYSYVLTNTGNVTLSSISVTDDKATVICPAVTTLLPGDSITCSAQYAVTQSDMDSGYVTNLATGSGVYSGTTYTATDTETVNGIQNPALTLDKTVNPTTYAAVGNVLSYTYELTNNGNVTLTSPAVSDDKVTVTCSAATLLPGASVTCSASYEIVQGDLDAGSVTNNATATCQDPNGATVTSNPDSATATAVQTPALALVKSAAPATYDQPGDVIGYSYLLTNSGNVPLDGPFGVNDDKVTVTCPQDTDPLPVGGSITCSASYTIGQEDLDNGFVTNVATASAVFEGDTVTSNQDDETVNAVQSPVMSIDKSANVSVYSQVGQLIEYEYVLTNTGNVTLNSPFSVNDDVTGSAVCDQPATLAPEASLTCTDNYMVEQEDLNAGSITNIASGQGYFGETPVPAGQDSVTVPAQVEGPALGLEKTVNPQTYSATTDSLSYSYVLANLGDVTLYAPFSVSDDKTTVACPALTSLDPGETITCTASYAITQADLDAGSVTNTATAQAYDIDENPVVSQPDTATATAGQTPEITLVKSVTPAVYSAVDDILRYDYLLTNSGNVTLSGFSVADDVIDLEGAVNCSLAVTPLAPGESTTCTADYAVTQPDLDTGEVTNLATAQGFFGQTPVVSNQDSETALAEVEGPSLAVEKTAAPLTYSVVGDVISYTYELTNNGDVTLQAPFTVADDKSTDETCPDTPASLAPGESLTCAATYTINQADLLAGFVTNTAQAQGYFEEVPVFSNEDSATVTAELLEPVVNIAAEDAPTCAVEPGEECITFMVTINGLTLGNVQLEAIEPTYLAPDQTVTFTQDGEYQITLCGDWPGIGDPEASVDLLLAGFAAWYVEEALQGQVGQGSARAYYDPEMEETCFPLEDLLIIDPFCELVGSDWTMAVLVENPNDEPVEFGWSINGSVPQVDNAGANTAVPLANLSLGLEHTIAITWGADGFAEQRARLDLVDCQSPTPPSPPPPPSPPDPQPIPVTAAEQPAPVTESGELIPVTGISLAALIEMGYLKQLAFFLGLGLLGMAFIIDSFWKRLK